MDDNRRKSERINIEQEQVAASNQETDDRRQSLPAERLARQKKFKLMGKAGSRGKKPTRSIKELDRGQSDEVPGSGGSLAEQLAPAVGHATQLTDSSRASFSATDFSSQQSTFDQIGSCSSSSTIGPNPRLPEGRMTRNLAIATLATAVGASFQHGYNQGVVNTPEKVLLEFINETLIASGSKPAQQTEAQVEFILALVVSIYCIGGCLGALSTAFVAERWGRKRALFYNCLIVLIAAPLMASSRLLGSYKILIGGRFLIGINAGLNAGLAPLYVNEIAPVNMRGSLGTVYQLVLTLSMLIANILGLPSIFGSHSSWPLLFIIPLLAALLMMLALPYCCESPKFLLLNQNRELQAQQALQWLRNTADVQEEMEELRCERESSKSLPPVQLSDLWRQQALLKATTISIVVVLSQQLSGINAILFYSTNIFRDAGLTQSESLSSTIWMLLVNFLMTACSMFIVDKAGRRTLHMTGLAGMAICCIVLGACLNYSASTSTIANDPSIVSYLAVLATFLFIIMFASGPGSIPWFIVGELFPSNARPLAMSVAVAFNWLANFTVTLSFLPLTNLLHGSTFYLFASFLTLFCWFTYYKVPETRGATSEEIASLFKRDIY